MSTTPSPFQDHAAPVLSNDPTLTDEKRASLWDIFHSSKDHNELAQKLQPEEIPDATKHALWQAKQASLPAPTPHDNIVAALQRMAQIDPKVLDLAESHPAVLKAFTSATENPAKGAKKPAGGRKAAAKDKTPSTAELTPTAPPDAATPPHVIVVAPQTAPSAPPEAVATQPETPAVPVSDTPAATA